MLMAVEGATVTSTAHLTGISVASLTGGACVDGGLGEAAAISVAWTASGFNPAGHVFKLYENGVLKVSQTTTSYQHVFSGYAEGGEFARFEANLTYRVDLCSLDGAVISSATAEPWIRSYGRCIDRSLPPPA